MKGLTDIPGLRVGHVSDYEALTGCTAILCDGGAVGGVDVRGSASGAEELDALSPLHVAGRVHAVVLAGGSAFGLEAASGVRRYLERKGVGFPTPAARVPIVVSAILYDLAIGKADVRPTREMGEAAAAAATGGEVAEGAVGAGTGATVGKLLGIRQAMKSGIGGATVWLDGPYHAVRVASLVAVNALGDIRDPESGALIAGARRSPESLELAGSERLMKRGTQGGLGRENTTLAVVATNARLDKVEATKLAQLAQLGLARTIYPVNTMSDGDLVFALSLGEETAGLDALGVAAAEAVAQGILRAVRSAPSMGGLPGLASIVRR
ncbi:MAG: P1 family peptidase [Acidobacteria bacterium]|nr:P1 family peptidase [Acidobacteriota bacterium]MBI3472645.1 P1 family peptidase [Candidatus Solibacter usitatus]